MRYEMTSSAPIPKSITSPNQIEADKAVNSPFISLSSTLIQAPLTAHTSQARLLHERLEGHFQSSPITDDKIPLKWTFLGLSVFCGLAWYGLYLAIS